mmetsp:Transcript_108787/g.347233  ORF Transcript_108787/g.347233 Transcript_108787/m.347233 type:complete len:222 (+) Transcript_108787:556-1221(+)
MCSHAAPLSLASCLSCLSSQPRSCHRPLRPTLLLPPPRRRRHPQRQSPPAPMCSAPSRALPRSLQRSGRPLLCRRCRPKRLRVLGMVVVQLEGLRVHLQPKRRRHVEAVLQLWPSRRKCAGSVPARPMLLPTASPIQPNAPSTRPLPSAPPHPVPSLKPPSAASPPCTASRAAAASASAHPPRCEICGPQLSHRPTTVRPPPRPRRRRSPCAAAALPAIGR